MDLGLKGKVDLVIASSRGLGQARCEHSRMHSHLSSTRQCGALGNGVCVVIRRAIRHHADNYRIAVAHESAT